MNIQPTCVCVGKKMQYYSNGRSGSKDVHLIFFNHTESYRPAAWDCQTLNLINHENLSFFFKSKEIRYFFSTWVNENNNHQGILCRASAYLIHCIWAFRLCFKSLLFSYPLKYSQSILCKWCLPLKSQQKSQKGQIELFSSLR